MTETQQNTSGKPDWAKSKREIRREQNPNQSSKARWVVVIILLLVIIGGVGWVLSKGNDVDTVEETTVAEVVVAKYVSVQELSTAEPKLVQKQIKVTGTIQPLRVAQIPSLISAQIDSVAYREGDSVTQGDIIVQMDTESIEIQKEQQLSATFSTETQLALAESQLKRTKELAQQGIATSSLLEEVQANVEALKANLNAQKVQIKSVDYSLRNATIKAPISGVISSRRVEPGQFIGVGSPLVEIVDLSVMELKVNVSTESNSLIKKGMQVDIQVEGLANKPFVGTISRISPIASQGTRTIPVYIIIENQEEMLRGGMFAIGNITLMEKANTITVENSAIQYDSEGQAYVFKVVDNQVVKQLVGLGDVWEAGRQEITSGLVSSDTYVNVFLSGLEENDLLNIIGG
jgi:RND family efflux transporter MFP subunit